MLVLWQKKQSGQKNQKRKRQKLEHRTIAKKRRIVSQVGGGFNSHGFVHRNFKALLEPDRWQVQLLWPIYKTR